MRTLWNFLRGTFDCPSLVRTFSLLWPWVKKRPRFVFMSFHCIGCDGKLLPGEKVFQLAWGHYMRSYITPTYDSWFGVIVEWHHRCLLMKFAPQMQPYYCIVCTQLVDDGDEVAYVTFGEKPQPLYKRLERRGYKLPLIAHGKCWPKQAACFCSQKQFQIAPVPW